MTNVLHQGSTIATCADRMQVGVRLGLARHRTSADNPRVAYRIRTLVRFSPVPRHCCERNSEISSGVLLLRLARVRVRVRAQVADDPIPG